MTPNITTLRDECSAAEAAYKRAKGAGNTRRAVDRLWRVWTLAKARLAAAGGV